MLWEPHQSIRCKRTNKSRACLVFCLDGRIQVPGASMLPSRENEREMCISKQISPFSCPPRAPPPDSFAAPAPRLACSMPLLPALVLLPGPVRARPHCSVLLGALCSCLLAAPATGAVRAARRAACSPPLPLALMVLLVLIVLAAPDLCLCCSVFVRDRCTLYAGAGVNRAARHRCSMLVSSSPYACATPAALPHRQPHPTISDDAIIALLVLKLPSPPHT